MINRFFLLVILTAFYSCFSFSGDEHREYGKIFHASIPNSSAVGGLYFGLYNDGQYQICSTGGVGQDCNTGKYELKNDTLTLLDLKEYYSLKSNKLLIKRIQRTEDDSFGMIVQLDSLNHELNPSETYFMIRLDSLNHQSLKIIISPSGN